MLRITLGVEGVGDVFAGRLLRSSSQLSRASVTYLLVWSSVLSCSLVSRASVTCLLGVELGVEVFFLVSRASVTCLLGMEQGVVVLFGVKGVDDVLVVRGAVFALLRVVPELSARVKSSSPSRAPHAN